MLQTCHLTLVVKSVPLLWHKGDGKANHVIDRRAEKRKQEKIRPQLVAETLGVFRVALLVI